MFVAIEKETTLITALERDLTLDAHYRLATSKWDLTRDDERFLHTIRNAPGITGRLVLSNRHVRYAAINYLIDVMLADFDAHPSRKRLFCTFCWDAGFTWQYAPNVDLVALQAAVDKVLRQLGLHGLGVIEFDTLTRIAGEPGRRLMFHVHVYAWSYEISFDHVEAAEELRATKRFPNNLDAPSVLFKPVTLTRGSIARLAEYMLKTPQEMKNRIESRSEPGTFMMRGTKFTPDSAVRVIEVLSHIQAFDVVFGVRDGTLLSRTWRKHMVIWDNSLRGKQYELDGTAADKHWAHIREDNGSRKMEPCRIITRAASR